jgi:hypothetical protein
LDDLKERRYWILKEKPVVRQCDDDDNDDMLVVYEKMSKEH